MSRQETVNTFTDGLVMDLNPITTPNSVLTNALNATLITYNGNEFVLQNDMGNGRVETAYLPAGYVPVGIKEYGGIIYVASYNPLTNKGQIGSFPSPERNISSDEINKALDPIISPDKFEISGNSQFIYKFKLFGDDTNTIIRPGDKFSIILESDQTIETLRKFVSNCLNVETVNEETGRKRKKISSPKNKLLSITVAVFDSNNNLRDITSQLKRFNPDNTEIEFDLETAPEVKLNDGFFMQSFPSSSITDDLVDNYREKNAVNIYNNKISGELYIITQLNTINSIDVSVRGYRNEGDLMVAEGVTFGKGTLLIFDNTIKYNCPDGYYAENPSKSDFYNTYVSYYGREEDFEPKQTIAGIEYVIKNPDSNETIYKLPFMVEPSEEDSIPVLDLATMLYSKKQMASYFINDKLTGIVKYKATPCMTYGSIVGLSVESTVELDLLGTGVVSINAWRYFYGSTSITFTWGLKAYPKEGTSIAEVSFDFFNAFTAENEYTYISPKKRSYNGIFTDNITLGSIKENSLYLVRIRYKLSDSDEYMTLGYRWMFTTPIYNNYYFGSVRDFKDLQVSNEVQLTLSVKAGTVSRVVVGSITDPDAKYSLSTFSEKEKLDVRKETEVNMNTPLSSSLTIDNSQYYPFSLSSTYSTAYSVETSQLIVPDLLTIGPKNVENVPNYINDTFIVGQTVDNSSSDISTGTYNSNKLYSYVKDSSLQSHAVVISRIFADLSGTSITVTYNNVYTPFLDKNNSSTFSKVFGYGGLGTLYATKEVAFVSRDKSSKNHPKVGMMSRSSKNSSDQEYKMIEWKDYGEANCYLSKHMEEITGFIKQSFGSGTTPTCVVMGNPGARTNNNHAYDGDSDCGLLNLVSDLRVNTNQILWWWNGSTYVMVDQFIYTQSQSGGTYFPSTEMPEIVYNVFKDIFIQTGESYSDTYYAMDKNSYVYNSKLNGKISTVVKCTANFKENTPMFIVNGQDYHTLIASSVKSIVEDPSEAEELIDEVTFTSDRIIEGTTSVVADVEIPDMASEYTSMYNLASGEASTNLAAINNNQAIFEDYLGNKLISNKIYCLESGTLKPAETSSKFGVIKNLKLSDGTLIVKAAPGTTKSFYTDRSGDTFWRFEGIPVVDIELKRFASSGSNVKWGNTQA